MKYARLLVTPGEPAGIGPDLLLQLAQREQTVPIVAVCDYSLLQSRAELLDLPITLYRVEDPQDQAEALGIRAGHINVIDVPLAQASTPGQLSLHNAPYVLETLRIATDLCLQKHFHAVVTGPVQKSIINDAGIAFSGHTEFFAQRSGVDKVVMMLATEGLRVALASTHLPLKDVAAAITRDSLTQVLEILIAELTSKFALSRPRILVAGLNPHAGEGGHLGTEEIDTIIPVIEQFKHHSADLLGPLPADTLFTPHYLAKADAVLAMYHDQGLPVLKHMGFGQAVNITLGLPFVRTSVDHGTALDLAGTGRADVGSLQEAFTLATRLAQPQVAAAR